MAKRHWWTILGALGVAAAGTGISLQPRSGSLAGSSAIAAGEPARAVVPNSSTDVNRLLKAYGIVRLSAMEQPTPTALPEVTLAGGAAAAEQASTTSGVIATAHTGDALLPAAQYQIERLPRTQTPGGLPAPRNGDLRPLAPQQPLAASPIASQALVPADRANPEIIRTGRYEPTDAPVTYQPASPGRYGESSRNARSEQRPTAASANPAPSLDWYEYGVNARRLPARSDENARSMESAAPLERSLAQEEIEQSRLTRRDTGRTPPPSPTQRRPVEDNLIAARPEARRENSVLRARAEEEYDAEPMERGARSEERARPAPIRQRYSANTEQDEAPQNGRFTPDRLASAVTSRREMLMVDEERFTEEQENASAPYGALARYRVQEPTTAYPVPEGYGYPPEGPNGGGYYGFGSCNTCGPSCGHCGWLWVFGSETTFLFADRNGVDAEVEMISSADRFTESADNDFGIGPRIWFGARSCKWEVLGRFWILGDFGDGNDPLAIGTADTRGIYNHTDIEALTADVELIRHFCCGPVWDIYCGVGFRYASLEQTARVSGTITNGAAFPAIAYADALAYNKINGPGITAMFGGSRLLHCYCCSNLNAFWNVRGSMIWGDTEAAAQTVAQGFDVLAGASAARLDAAYASTDGDLFIGEVQVGLRWCHPLRCMPAVASVHVAFETQWWDVDGGIAIAESAAIANSVGGAGSASSGPNAEVSLIGLNTGCGLTW